MRKKSILDALLPVTRQRILALTMGTPDRWWYLSEIAASLGIGVSSLQRELDSLTRASILLLRRDGRRTYYKANEAGAIFLELRGIVRKTIGFPEEIRSAPVPVPAAPVPDFDEEEESVPEDTLIGDSDSDSDFID